MVTGHAAAPSSFCTTKEEQKCIFMCGKQNIYTKHTFNGALLLSPSEEQFRKVPNCSPVSCVVDVVN